MNEAEKEKRHITLNLYDTKIPVYIDPEDEELYRRAGSLITQTVNNYASVYKGFRSDKEMLYMALIDIALMYEREAGRNDVGPVEELMDKLSEEIEAALS